MKGLFIALTLLCTAFSANGNEQQKMLGNPSFHERHQEVVKSSAARSLKQENDDQPRELFCPDPETITPCVCTLFEGSLYLDCSNANTVEEINEVFQMEFPIQSFAQFAIFFNNISDFEEINFTTNGVSFEEFLFISEEGSGALTETITEDVFRDSAGVVTEIHIVGLPISDGGFPFHKLAEYPALNTFELRLGALTEMPNITSDSLRILELQGNSISVLNKGAFDGLPSLYQFRFQNNLLTELKTGTVPYNSYNGIFSFIGNRIQTVEEGVFYDSTTDETGRVFELMLEENEISQLPANSIPVTFGTHYIILSENGLQTIEPGAFAIFSEPELNTIVLMVSQNALTTVDEEVFGTIMPYVREFRLKDNPLECGCDIGWLVQNPTYLSKVTEESICNNGIPVINLDPEYFETYC